jgi:thiazole synthase
LTIRLNGEPYDVAGPITLSALLESLNIDPRRVAVERNLVVVKRQQYPMTVINERDEIEIVNFVGGG